MKKLLLLTSAIWIGCQPSKEKADLLVVNANVYTVDANFSKAGAFVVKDGKFLAVGSSEELRKMYAADQLIDVGGKTITPGLIDAHCHFYGLGVDQQTVDLVGTQSFGEILQRVKAFQEENHKNFILGRGWDQNDWEIKEFPTKKELDSLFPTTPVALARIDGHALLVNQKALDLAGIDENTHIEGGEIVKRKSGNRMELTGVLVDNPMARVYAIMPQLSLTEKVEALKDAEKICLSYGLTTVNDAGLDRSTIELIDSLQKKGELSIRVYAMIGNSQKNLEHYLALGPIKTSKLNVRSVKVYGDGALGSRGAALRQPYSDQPGHYGALVTPVADIESLAQKLARSEYQMNTHAIGDSANIVVLRAYRKALEGQKDRRWKIEHAQVITPADLHYFAEGIIPSVQPTHATSDMYWAEDRLGPERIKGAYAFKALLEKAGTVALGTDFPVEQVSPFLTFYAAVARQDLKGHPKGGFQMDQALTREQALKGMTIWAAHSNFEDHEKGSIEVGKLADFTVYSDDLMKVPVKEIPHIRAEQTYIDGKAVKR